MLLPNERALVGTLEAAPGLGPVLHACTAAPDAETTATVDLATRDAAWSTLILRWRRPIAKLFSSELRSHGFRGRPDQVDDALQDLWLKLLSTRKPFRGTTDPEAWGYLLSCMRHAASDRRRAAAALRRAPEIRPGESRRPRGRRRSTHRRRRAGCIGSDGPVAFRATMCVPTPSPTSLVPGRRSGLLGPSIDHETPEVRALRREALRGFYALCRRTAARRLRRRAGGCSTTRRRAEALARAFIDGESSAELARRFGGRPTAREIDQLATTLRRRMLGDGVELPRRSGRVR